MSSQLTELRDLIDSLTHIMVWTTDQEGKVITAIGGCLRLLGLSPTAVIGTPDSQWGDLSRLHRESMMGLSAIDRFPGTAFFRNAHGKTFVVCWGPYFEVMPAKQSLFAPVGAVVLLIDVTSLESATIQRLEEKLDEVLPYVRTLAEVEIERLEIESEGRKLEIDVRREQAKQLPKNRAQRWQVLKSVSNWIGERAVWLFDRIGYAITILATVFAMWVALKLGVPFPEVKVVPGPVPQQIVPK